MGVNCRPHFEQGWVAAGVEMTGCKGVDGEGEEVGVGVCPLLGATAGGRGGGGACSGGKLNNNFGSTARGESLLTVTMKES